MSSNAWARRVAIVAAVVVVGYGGYRIFKKLTRSDENKALEARQDKARERVGDGLDDVFEAALDDDTNRLWIDARFTLASDVTGKYTPPACARGFEQAFEEALGPDVLKVEDSSYVSIKKYPLEVVAKLTRTDRQFVLAHSEEPFPGIAMAGDVTLGGKTVHVEVEPGEDISFEYTRMSFDVRKIDADDVSSGIIQATCKEAAYVALEKLTTWHRPAKKESADPVADCERGFHCVENADAIAESDPGKAEKLYAAACMTKNARACSRLAAVVVASPAKTDQAHAQITLEMTCNQDVAAACVGGAMVSQVRGGAFYLRAALTMAVRGCDLGEHDGCETAAQLVKGTPFAEAAPALISGRPIASKRMGTLLGLHWGQWTKLDNGQPTLWVTKRPTGLPAGTIVREFALEVIPPGITAPPGVNRVFAVAFQGGSGGDCERCSPSGGGDSIYSMRALDCVCVITRENP